jgi:hypothetical protein
MKKLYTKRERKMLRLIGLFEEMLTGLNLTQDEAKQLAASIQQKIIREGTCAENIDDFVKKGCSSRWPIQ